MSDILGDYLKVLLFLNHNSTDRACHPVTDKHTHKHIQLGISANGKGVSGAQPLRHTLTLQDCYLPQMHFAPRHGVKANWLVENKSCKSTVRYYTDFIL